MAPGPCGLLFLLVLLLWSGGKDSFRARAGGAKPDESGNQLAVFGRRGARPLNRAEAQSLYLRNEQLYTVSDEPVLNPQSGQPTTSYGVWLDRVKSWFWPPKPQSSPSSR